jgi:hypothetical protein
VLGNGGYLDLMARGNSDFQLEVAVFDGFDCDNLECVATSEVQAGRAGVTSWKTIKDVLYYILIHGVGPTEGSFEIMVVPGKKEEVQDDTPVEIEIIMENDRCSGAIGPLREDIVLTSSTKYARMIDPVRTVADCLTNAGNQGR